MSGPRPASHNAFWKSGHGRRQSPGHVSGELRFRTRSVYKTCGEFCNFPYVDEHRWRDDRDLAEWIEREQIAVAGDDQVRVAVDRQLEKFVVRGIAAGGNALGDRHQLGRRQHPRQTVAQRGDRRRFYILRRRWCRRPASSNPRLDVLLGSLDQPIDGVLAEVRGDHEAARFLAGFGQPVVRLDHHRDHALLGNAKALQHIGDLAGRGFEYLDFLI